MRPVTLLSALGAALALAGAAPALADPRLPAGWIAGGPAAPMTAEAAPNPRSREALQLASSPLRPALAPVPVALDAFELVEVTPALTEKEAEASNADPPGEPATDFFVDRGCGRASVSGHAIGTVQVGWASEPIGPQSGGGVDLWHVRGSRGGDGKHRFAHAAWETIDRLPDGTLRYMAATGRFDVRTCKTTLHSRYTAVARPILGGLAFVFRTRCAACAPAQRDGVHLLLPTSGWGNDPYAHSTLQVGPESAGSTRIQVDRARLDRFGKTVGRSLPAPPEGRDVLVGFELVKGLGEAEPSVIAYAAEVRHVGF
jgi:hypothetical protein